MGLSFLPRDFLLIITNGKKKERKEERKKKQCKAFLNTTYTKVAHTNKKRKKW